MAFIRVQGADALGYWQSRTNAIVLADSQVGNGSVVRHEMLHALLREQGHPRSQFVGSCYGWVNCGDCAPDGAGETDGAHSAAALMVDSVQLGVALLPPSPSMTVDDGFFSVVITARNPWNAPAIVPLGLQLRRPPLTYGVELSGPAGGIIFGEVVLDPADSTFGPLESKRFVYDFQLGSRLDVRRPPPGRYLIRGRYGGRWTAPLVTNIGLLPADDSTASAK